MKQASLATSTSDDKFPRVPWINQIQHLIAFADFGEAPIRKQVGDAAVRLDAADFGFVDDLNLNIEASGTPLACHPWICLGLAGRRESVEM